MKLLSRIFASLLLCHVATGFAHESAQQATQNESKASAASNENKVVGIKIGIVDLKHLMETSPKMIQIRENLESKFQARHASLEKLHKQADANQHRLDKEREVMTETEIAVLEKTVLMQRTRIYEEQNKFEQDFLEAQARAMNVLLAQVKAVIVKVAAKGNYGLIVEKESDLYNLPELDITDDVLAELDS